MQPIFGKRQPHIHDFKQITWKMFLNLRKWASEVKQEIGYPIYLVGSSLYKDTPRDIDVVIIIPVQEYENMYGELPEKQEDVGAYLAKVYEKTPDWATYYFDGLDALGGKAHFDLKLYPDTWFVKEPKILISD